MGAQTIDVNALSCATSQYPLDTQTDKVNSVSLDLSKCKIENESLDNLKMMAEKAAKLNFGKAVLVRFK